MKTFTRQDYLNGICTHREYYAQFVTPGLIAAVVAHMDEKTLLASTNRDGCMNDIALIRWDGAARSHVQGHQRITRELKARGDGYSLAGGVCICKEAARQWLDSIPNSLKG